MGINTIDWHGFRVDPDNLPQHRPGVYLLTNLIDDKKYVGVGGLSAWSTVFKRLRSHTKNGSPKKLKNAILKHGLMSFLAQPVFYSLDGDPVELLLVEAFLIQDYDSIKWGYNIQEYSGNGAGAYGPEFGKAIREGQDTPEYRTKWAAIRADPVFQEKHRESLRAYFRLPGSVEVSRQASTKMWTTEEFRANRAAAFARPEVIEKRNAIFTSKEYRARSSERGKKMWADPLMHESISNSVREAWADPKLRQEQSERLKIAFSTPEARAKKSAASKIAQNRPEVKAARSEAMSKMIWINDGKSGLRIPNDQPVPEGWQVGRLTVWVTDGTTNLMHSRNNPLPEGYRLGRFIPTRY